MRGSWSPAPRRPSCCRDLRDAVQKAIVDGGTLEQFRRDFDEIVARHGWEYTGGRNWRTRVIFETNLRTSYAAGRYAQLKANTVAFPYWQYKHSHLDKVPRPLHVTPTPVGWNGLVLRHDDPWWDVHYPPNGWGCFPGDTAVRCDPRLGLKGWYSGEMVELNTAGGNRLPLTVNHPVLTGRGWIAAAMLQEGDEVIRASSDVDPVVRGIVDDEKAPARSEVSVPDAACAGTSRRSNGGGRFPRRRAQHGR